MPAATTDLDLLLARASDPAGFERWLDLARSTGWCEHPVRLAGTTHQIDPGTGEIVSSYTTAGEPDGHLLKACGTRRATVCEPCSATYRADAWHLIAAGLRGGKGVPEDAATHPDAVRDPHGSQLRPGPLTARRERLRADVPPAQNSAVPARPSAPIAGRRISSDDDRLGEPLCHDCFDYVRAVLWNAHATELWRRTTIGIRRELAKVMGVGSSRFADHARVSYAKVVEYQDRGLVHLHVVIRLDGPTGPADPPPEGLTPERFEAAVVSACQRTHFSYPTIEGVTGEIRWGEQIDVRQVALDSVAPGAVAAYIAKYATKSTDAFGRLDHRLRETDLVSLDVRPHLKRLVHHSMGSRWPAGARAPEAPPLGTHARVPGPLAHQEPALLHHARCTPIGPRPVVGEPARFDTRGTGVRCGQGLAVPGTRMGQPRRRVACPYRSGARQPKPGSWPGKHVWRREGTEGGTVEKLLLTPSEAAKALSISRSKLYELIGQGRLSTVRIDTSRRVPAQALVEFIQHLQHEEAECEA